MIYDTKVCDRCCRNTHHIDHPCCWQCTGMVRCRSCRRNYHHKRFPTCYECSKKPKSTIIISCTHSRTAVKAGKFLCLQCGRDMDHL